MNTMKVKYNSHNSEKLNALLGKKVKLVLFDGCEHIGILEKSEHMPGYKIVREYKGPIHFYKTHVKKIKEQ